MDTQEALTQLQSLRNTFVDEATGAQGKIDALDTAFTLLKDGYQIDQQRIDTEIQKAKDAVAAQVTSLTSERDGLQTAKAALEQKEIDLQTRIDELEAQLSVITNENITLKNDKEGLDQQIVTLQAEIADLKAQIPPDEPVTQ